MEVSEFLKNTKALIDSPEKWTTGQYARDVNGNTLAPYEFDQASCFCTLGAVKQTRRTLAKGATVAVAEEAYDTSWAALEVLTEVLANRGAPVDVAFFNDTHTHPEVMALFDEAIAKASGG